MCNFKGVGSFYHFWQCKNCMFWSWSFFIIFYLKKTHMHQITIVVLQNHANIRRKLQSTKKKNDIINSLNVWWGKSTAFWRKLKSGVFSSWGVYTPMKKQSVEDVSPIKEMVIFPCHVRFLGIKFFFLFCRGLFISIWGKLRNFILLCPCWILLDCHEANWLTDPYCIHLVKL